MSFNIKIRTLVSENKKVIENYFFMTMLQVLNSCFYLFLYPYLIRTLGAESYGKFVFITSIITYFVFLINFGFDMPATKEMALARNDKGKQSHILSGIFSCKLSLSLISIIVLIILRFFVPFIEQNFKPIIFCFLQVFSYVIFPQWYFQAIQNMRIVTFIQLLSKILTLPLVFLLIKSPQDLNIYFLIVSAGFIIGALLSLYFILFDHKLTFRFVSPKVMFGWFKEGLPFFLSNSTGVIKEQSITLIIGSFFGMKDVAIYDLANKVITIPRTLLMSVNGAIFPKIILDSSKGKIRKILKIEFFLSLLVIIGIVALGSPVITILGNGVMHAAYPLAILLSVSIISWLIVGAYISFIFVPENVTYYVVKNQLVALFSFTVFSIVGLYFYRNIYVLGWAMVFSTFSEILYCSYIVKKNKFL
ncbi:MULTISPECIES: oligosaccharide flippase family protein [Sphingobacterium]|uniref:oligosaccharide flippase family protein n=1 Tax=Sphingobacterium TaxID=28453 RepID=UPI00257BE134|nr:MULTISPECIES: oligosaccharide flippase family protein [Sphingobacterium]